MQNPEIRTKNKWTSWAKPSELWTQFVRKIISADIHTIVTMRSKTKYAQTDKDSNGRSTVVKLGLEPIMKSEFEYEFDVFAELDRDSHQLIINKTRIPILDNSVLPPATPELGTQIVGWLNDGTIDSSKLAVNDTELIHKIDEGEFVPEVKTNMQSTPSKLETLLEEQIKEAFPNTDRQLTKEEADKLAELAIKSGYTPALAGKALKSIGINGKLTDCNASQILDITKVFTDKALLAQLKNK